MIMVSIAKFGLVRSLRPLENFEKLAVNLMLALIASFLLGFSYLQAADLVAGYRQLPGNDPELEIRTLHRISGCSLLIRDSKLPVFRRLSPLHPCDARTMAFAQAISATVYIVFITLATACLDTLEELNEISVLCLSRRVTGVLPKMLILDTLKNQFSSTVADTTGAGRFLDESNEGRIKRCYVHAVAMALALLLLWSSDAFTVITSARRAFALYYLLQCLTAMLHLCNSRHDWRDSLVAMIGFILLTLTMLLIAVFAIPADPTRGSP
ncbi:MAG: hypothetical protein R3F50_19005 [Gammaproteobacteria bacterium]